MTNTSTVVIEQNNAVIVQQLRLKLQEEEYSKAVLIQDTHTTLDNWTACSSKTVSSPGNTLRKPAMFNIIKFYYQNTYHKNCSIPSTEKPIDTRASEKKLQEIKSKYYFIGITKIVRKWVQGCETGFRDKRSSNASITPELLILPEVDLRPKDAMQIDLLPKHLVAAMKI